MNLIYDKIKLHQKGDVSLAKADGSFVLGTDNFNGYIKGNAELLSASGHAEFEFENDRFAIGLGGEATGVNVSYSAGVSFLEYDNSGDKGNLFGIQGGPKLDARVSANFSLSGEKAMNFGPVDINAVNLKLGDSLGLGFDLDLTLPIPTWNFGWRF